MTTVGDVLAWIEARMPTSLAEDWDVVGLAVGDPAAEVKRVHFAVDPTLEVVREAVQAGAQLIVTHHPLMLRGVTSVAADTVKGAVVHTLVTSGVALICAHTNADAALGGTNDALAQAFGLAVEGPLVPANAGKPGEGAGRVGAIEPTTLQEFAQTVASALPATAGGVLYAGDRDGLVSRVAVMGGSGDSYIGAAEAAGVDVFVTADLRHHPASEAREAAGLRGGKPYLINVSHAASESLWLAATAAALENDTGLLTHVSTLSTDPWTGRVGQQ